ncbi:MAG TPA: 4Fe-4S binding protein [Thermoplasmata archaeon]|jgi:NAD-dependent dihydropyrimidine dehydrogenase PreA subunit
MSDLVYENLAEALDKLPNGFPRTPSKVEIRILKKLFSPEEASLGGQMGRTKETPDVIASRTGLTPEEARTRLLNMADKGLAWNYEEDGKSLFRLAPFIVGIYEASSMDHELAHMIEEYLSTGGAEGIMRPQPAIHRVVPAQKAVKSEWILPYDDVKAILTRSKSFVLRDCICRDQQKHVGNECRFPLRTCLSFSDSESPPGKSSISKDEALAFLDKAEELGLVHTVNNVTKGIGYVCNCCGCCCGLLRGITDWGIENSVASANYFARIDPDECVGCGTCNDRCQVHAIREENGVSVVDLAKCIGCGLCVTGCPNGAAQLEKKPEAEVVPPAADFKTWEDQRLRNRGLTG